jgi:hypothetical protein
MIMFKHQYLRPRTSPEEFLPQSEYLYMSSEHAQKGCERYIFYSQRYRQNQARNTPTTRLEKPGLTGLIENT